MEENETIPTTSQEKTTVPDVNVEEEAKMQNVATSRMRFRIHLGLFVLINLIIWVLYFTLFNAIVTDYSIKWAILHYCIAFKWNKTLVEKELNRIRKQRSKQLKKIEELKAQIQKDTVKEEQSRN